MKIKKADRDSIKTSLTNWAKKNKARMKEEADFFLISKNGWMIEVRPEDGWAYLHGGGSLSGVSTNIESMDKFDDGVKRLTGAK